MVFTAFAIDPIATGLLEELGVPARLAERGIG
jgi:hypothetical protein